MTDAESDGLQQFITGDYELSIWGEDPLRQLIIARNKIDEIIKEFI